MTKTTCICDRCGREILEAARTWIVIGGTEDDSRNIDLCTGCRAALGRFLLENY